MREIILSTQAFGSGSTPSGSSLVLHHQVDPFVRSVLLAGDGLQRDKLLSSDQGVDVECKEALSPSAAGT